MEKKQAGQQVATGSDMSDVDAQTDALPADVQPELNLEDK